MIISIVSLPSPPLAKTCFVSQPPCEFEKLWSKATFQEYTRNLAGFKRVQRRVYELQYLLRSSFTELLQFAAGVILSNTCAGG